MLKSDTIGCSTSEYWEKIYRSGETSWDLGQPTPIFNQWIENSAKKNMSICILGAGNGWDALNISNKGHDVTAVDFAASAIYNMRKMADKLDVNLNLVHSDIFDIGKIYHADFDIVLEYTCYCAIDLDRRTDYVNLVNRILKPDGKLVALFFPLDTDLNNDYPPFGIDLKSTLKLFSKHFTVDVKEIPKLSIERRKGREIFVILNKNGN